MSRGTAPMDAKRSRHSGLCAWAWASRRSRRNHCSRASRSGGSQGARSMAPGMPSSIASLGMASVIGASPATADN